MLPTIWFEPRLLASLVDPGQVLLEEVGVLLVAHGGVGGEIDHDHGVPFVADVVVACYSSDSRASTSSVSMVAHSGRGAGTEAL